MRGIYSSNTEINPDWQCRDGRPNAYWRKLMMRGGGMHGGGYWSLAEEVGQKNNTGFWRDTSYRGWEDREGEVSIIISGSHDKGELRYRRGYELARKEAFYWEIL